MCCLSGVGLFLLKQPNLDQEASQGTSKEPRYIEARCVTEKGGGGNIFIMQMSYVCILDLVKKHLKMDFRYGAADVTAETQQI